GLAGLELLAQDAIVEPRQDLALGDDVAELDEDRRARAGVRRRDVGRVLGGEGGDEPGLLVGALRASVGERSDGFERFGRSLAVLVAAGRRRRGGEGEGGEQTGARHATPRCGESFW